MKLLDCTLRDGGNVVGKGFDARLTKMMIEGLIACNIQVIEMGNCLGIGAYEARGSKAPCTDVEYLELVQPYLNQAEIGMFMGYKQGTEENIALAKQYGLRFLRVGANAGEGKQAAEAVKRVKAAGLVCRYSMMKAYVLSAEELAEEAAMLEACGLDEITIMDSAGTMMPDEVETYCRVLCNRVNIPVGFHGHNNLGLSVANALAAHRGGATVFDCGLLGMARSAGNCATELAVAAFQRMGAMADIDLMKLLEFLDNELIPAMAEYGYHPAVSPLDLVLGIAGAHSSFTKLFQEVSSATNAPLYQLILEVSKVDRKNPDRALMEQIAASLVSTS